MKQRLLFLLLFLFLANPFFAQRLSDSAKIYILVCSPGDELYQAFGHNAFWVVDESRRVNYIFHYGTFNFADPNFYVKFIRGRLDYMLSIEGYEYFIKEYSGDGRDVWKLELNITNKEANNMFEYLMWKSREENKYYKYDFFMDNCATRIRDVLERTYGDSLIYNEQKINLTFRKAIKPYLKAKPWVRFGTNLLLGLPADKKLDFYSAMFLPYYIDSVYNVATLQYDGKSENLVTNRDYMIFSDFKIGKTPILNPSFVFWALFLILAFVTSIEFRKRKIFKGIDFTYYLITGIAGLLMLFMWLGTDHTPTKWNLNLLWAFPVHAYFAFVYLKDKKKNFISKYSIVFAVINIILVITFPFFPQQFDVALIPFFLIFGIRFFVEHYMKSKFNI